MNIYTGLVTSGGIELQFNTIFRLRSHEKHKIPVLEKYVFVPYINSKPLHEDELKAKKYILEVFAQIISENNCWNMTLKVLEFHEDSRLKSKPIISDLKNIFLQFLGSIINGTIVTTNVVTLNQLENDGIKVVNIADYNEKSNRKQVVDLIIISGEDDICEFVHLLAGNGFFMIETLNVSSFEPNFPEGLEIISTQITNYKKYFLIRKCENFKGHIATIRIEYNKYSWLESFKTVLTEHEERETRIILYSQSEPENGITGLVNCLRYEIENVTLNSFSVDEEESVAFNLATYSDQIRKNLLHNVLKKGSWGSYRHLSIEEMWSGMEIKTEHAYLDFTVIDELSCSQWIQAPWYPLEEQREFCHVHYAAINHCGVMRSSDGIPLQRLSRNICNVNPLFEFSGVDSRGKRIMSWSFGESLSTTMNVISERMIEVPDTWTLEEAATVPIAYIMAYSALIVRGKLKFGESILIHEGASDIGIAAISIALEMGCTVFTTVSTATQESFLKETYFQLNPDHISSSLDTSFEQMILTQTESRGVDLVWYTLSLDLKQASINCLTLNGRFLDIGNTYLQDCFNLTPNIFPRGITFHSILLSDSDAHVTELVKEGITNGTVKPLPRTIFKHNEVDMSIKYLSKTEYLGKVLIEIKNEESQEKRIGGLKNMIAIARTYMNPKKSYIIIGGLGGFGLELANWLICRGAKYIVLTSRNGIKSTYQTVCIERWRKAGVKVLVSTDDAATIIGVRELLQKTMKLAPVGGIFNSALILKDAYLLNQTEETFSEVCVSKINITKQLDIATREMCPVLDYFVVFSTVVSGRGGAGQTNYGYANASAERICEIRRQFGYPGLAIQWGRIGNVGYTAELGKKISHLTVVFKPQPISSCLHALDIFLQQLNTTVSSIFIEQKLHSEEHDEGMNILQSIARILGMKDMNDIPGTSTLVDIGMDSLLSSEIKQSLEANYNILLSSKDIRALTVRRLRKLGNVHMA